MASDEIQRLANFVEIVAQGAVMQSNILQAREDVAALREENTRLRAALREAVSGINCHNLHHSKAERHEWDETCPVYARLKALAEGGRE